MAPRLRPLLAALAILTAAACTAAETRPLERSEAAPDTAAPTTSRDEPLPTVPPDDAPADETTTTAPATTAPPTTLEPFEPEPADLHALTPPEPAPRAAGLARQIADAEQTIRDEGSTAAQVAEAALAHQVAYRALGARPEWDERVLAALPAELHGAAIRNAEARREFRGMHTRLGENLPAWRIIEPAPAEDLLRWYHEAEAEFGVPWAVLAAVNLVETGMGRIHGLSIAGARGPMQFMPGTWEAYGEGDIDDPRDAIRGAARYLAANGGGRGELENALFHYNRSNRYVRGVLHYAALIEEHPQAFDAYYHWGIWFLTAHGDIYLPVGYEETESVPVLEYLDRG